MSGLDDTLQVLAAGIAAAPVAAKAPAADETAPAANGGDVQPPGPRAKGELPKDCPVTPLGKVVNIHFYLDANHQLIELSARDHSRNNLASMFGIYAERLEEWWPRRKLVKERDAEGNVVERYITTGFKVEDCADDLMISCARRGVWRPADKLRGLGAWVEDDGGLLYHCGDCLWTEEGPAKTGWRGGYVYPSYPPLPQPYDEAVPAGEEGPGHELFELLRSWNWLRQDLHVDATLMLGWIGAAQVGGALDWRPMCFVTGDKGTGKSTLLKIVKQMFGAGLIACADTTSAGIAQRIGISSLPVAIDEIEADGDNRRQQDVIRLARLSSSGDERVRGGASHSAHTTLAQSCFLFSAIIRPPLDDQDESRLAVLRLNPLERNQRFTAHAPEFWRDLGRKIKRRLADQWHRYHDTHAAYEEMLFEVGHEARGAQQFAPLLACADLLLYSQVPDTDSLKEWHDVFRVEKFAETARRTSTSQRCLDWLAQSQPEAHRGGSRKTVAELILDFTDPGLLEQKGHNRALMASAGLAVVTVRANGTSYLAVPYTHKLLAPLFKDTAWASRPGTSGGWIETLTRLPGVLQDRTAKIGHRSTKTILVPIDLVLNAAQDKVAEGSAPPADSEPLPA